MLNIYILLFLIYSFLGWLLEVGNALVTEKKFVNRGFLMGPYCPIYGCGCLLLVWRLSKYTNDLFALFASAMILCSILEYFTSYFMELIFKMRWWDYSNYKFNINGRICLETMAPFGIIGILIVRYVNPFFLNIILKISPWTLNICIAILASLFIIDLTVSSNVVFNLKSVVKTSKKDSTEDIKLYIKNKIKHNKVLYNRLVNAFPRLRRIVKQKRDEIKNKKD